MALVAEVLAEFGLHFGVGCETDHPLTRLPASYDDAGGAFWVAIDGSGALLGTCGVYPLSPGVWELRKMYVSRSSRGLGLGKRLLDASIAWLRARGAREVVLDTTEQMQRAIALYERNGFVRDDAHRRGARCSRGYVRRLDLPATGEVGIDLATDADVPAMLRLSNLAAETGAANFATEPERLDEWQGAWEATHAHHPWLVARSGERIVGFAKASPHRARGAYRFTAEVTVYVDTEHHGRGIAGSLYRHLVPTLRAQGYATLLAGIAKPNAASQRLHAAFGFEPCGTFSRVGWKLGAWHDVGYWQLALVDGMSAPDPVLPVFEIWPKVRRARERGPDLEREPLASEAARALVGALDRELSATYPEPGATHFRLDEAEVSAGGGAFLVARLEAEPVGCGAVRILGGGAAEIKRMFVAPRWRGLGISRAILAALEARARASGVGRMLLETGTRQREALALYERAGYVPGPAFGEYVSSPLSVCMEKPLPPLP